MFKTQQHLFVLIVLDKSLKKKPLWCNGKRNFSWIEWFL